MQGKRSRLSNSDPDAADKETLPSVLSSLRQARAGLWRLTAFETTLQITSGACASRPPRRRTGCPLRD